LTSASSHAPEKADTRELKDIAKAAFDSMLSREMRWLRGLSQKEQERLDQGEIAVGLPDYQGRLASKAPTSFTHCIIPVCRTLF
jgi:hypothetical protein